MSRYSRYCEEWFQYPHYRSDPEAFVDTLAEFLSSREIGTYLPSHEEGFVVAKHLDRLPAEVSVPISDFATIERLDNQRKSNELARDLGIPHPVTFTFDCEDDFEESFLELPERGVIKEVVSHGAHGVALYTSRNDLRAAWNRTAFEQGAASETIYPSFRNASKRLSTLPPCWPTKDGPVQGSCAAMSGKRNLSAAPASNARAFIIPN